MGIIISLLIGALAGFLGSKLFAGASNGLLLDLLIGIIGGSIGGFLFGDFFNGLTGIPYVGEIVTATLGAVILLWIISFFKKK